MWQCAPFSGPCAAGCQLISPGRGANPSPLSKSVCDGFQYEWDVYLCQGVPLATSYCRALRYSLFLNKFSAHLHAHLLRLLAKSSLTRCAVGEIIINQVPCSCCPPYGHVQGTLYFSVTQHPSSEQMIVMICSSHNDQWDSLQEGQMHACLYSIMNCEAHIRGGLVARTCVRECTIDNLATQRNR